MRRVSRTTKSIDTVSYNDSTRGCGSIPRLRTSPYLRRRPALTRSAPLLGASASVTAFGRRPRLAALSLNWTSPQARPARYVSRMREMVTVIHSFASQQPPTQPGDRAARCLRRGLRTAAPPGTLARGVPSPPPLAWLTSLPRSYPSRPYQPVMRRCSVADAISVSGIVLHDRAVCEHLGRGLAVAAAMNTFPNLSLRRVLRPPLHPSSTPCLLAPPARAPRRSARRPTASLPACRRSADDTERLRPVSAPASAAECRRAQRGAAWRTAVTRPSPIHGGSAHNPPAPRDS